MYASKEIKKGTLKGNISQHKINVLAITAVTKCRPSLEIFFLSKIHILQG
jgi:hypothetical protein